MLWARLMRWWHEHEAVRCALVSERLQLRSIAHRGARDRWWMREFAAAARAGIRMLDFM